MGQGVALHPRMAGLTLSGGGVAGVFGLSSFYVNDHTNRLTHVMKLHGCLRSLADCRGFRLTQQAFCLVIYADGKNLINAILLP